MGDHDHGDHGDHDHGDHGHGDHDMDHGDHDHHAGHMMNMWFHISLKAVILFEEWSTQSQTDMILSCVAMVVLGVLHEAIKVFREYMYRQLQRGLLAAPAAGSTGFRPFCTCFSTSCHTASCWCS